MSAEGAQNATWPLRTLSGGGDLPRSLVTRAPMASSSRLPVPTALLLPNGDGSDPAVLGRGGKNVAAGLFLASPLLRPDVVADRLLAAGFGWVCNMPSVAQHDAQFTGFLDDVAMGRRREEEVLQRLGHRGLRILHAMATVPLPALASDAVLVVPRVDGSRLDGAALHRAGWAGPILAFDQSEMP